MDNEINSFNSNIELIEIGQEVSKSKFEKYSELVRELIRYSFVGVSSFFLDAFVLHLSKYYLFSNTGQVGVLISSALGFIVGLIYNYLLSVRFVFKKVNENMKSTTDMFIIFTIIGIVGFLLTEIGMIFGMKIFSVYHYMDVKIVVALIVFIWNYTARKIMVF